MRHFNHFCLTCGLLLAMTTLARAGSDLPEANGQKNQTGTTLKTSVLAAGGAAGASSGFRTMGTLGQPSPVGAGSTSTQNLYSGFWYAYQRLAGLTDVVIPDVLRNRLYQNFPNPFNPSTTIEYTVAAAGPVTVAVYSIRGERLRTLVSEEKLPGSYRVVWDGHDEAGRQVASGLYFCRMSSRDFESVKKMLMVK